MDRQKETGGVSYIFQGYRVQYSLDGDAPGSLWPSKTVEGREQLAVGELLFNQTYHIRVLAFNELGEGPPSPIIEVKLRQPSESFLLQLN